MNDTLDNTNLHIDVAHLSSADAVSQLVEHAANLGVSDLFFTTHEKHVSVAARHLGLLRLLSIIPLEMGRRCMTHIKASASMDVAERRRPLDGRWIYQRPNGTTLDLRVNSIPTLHGEDFTLRLLARDSRLLKLEDLGLLQRDFNHLLGLLNSPSGLILVTGPTGAGKTTTLYACLSYLNNGKRKINTIEDPIEYAIEGIRQSQINPKIDVGFPELLRGILRQAPDVIMIGEIRDPVTAETAVRAANSGHLVLTTLHAPVAAGSIQNLLSLGVHPHFLASCFLGAIAQRLCRTLCPKCKVPFDLSDAPHTFDEVKQWLEPGQGNQMFGPRGCPECRMMGYSGRTGVFEVLPATPAIRHMIATRDSTQAIRGKAMEEGMIEFRHSALLKVARGETSVEEVLRVIPSEHLGLDGEF
jgi:type II secretory ATPase GspE/PulE/Tfp pilus assembly ATPase PilB-like protein